MRKWIFILALAFAGNGAAQAPPQKYEEIPAEMYHLLIDHVGQFPSMTYTGTEGTYQGQISPDVHFYGFGRYKNDNNRQTGIYRNGKFVYGITMNQKFALVGSTEYYAAYNLGTGKLEYIYRNQEKQLYNTSNLTDYQFMAMNYQNGDKYIGEVYKGQRHGYGMYLYKDGRIWFGQYIHGMRNGFGALFTTDKGMKIGQWIGEKEIRVLPVKIFQAKK